jgi:hypothetical protein
VQSPKQFSAKLPYSAGTPPAPGKSRAFATPSQQLRPRSALLKLPALQKLQPEQQLQALENVLRRLQQQPQLGEPNQQPGPPKLSLGLKLPQK